MAILTPLTIDDSSCELNGFLAIGLYQIIAFPLALRGQTLIGLEKSDIDLGLVLEGCALSPSLNYL